MPTTGRCLLYLGRAVLVHGQLAVRGSHDSGPSRLPELQRRLRIAVHKYLLDRHLVRRELADELHDFPENRPETITECRAARGNAAASDIPQPRAIDVEDPVTGNAGTRVDAENARHGGCVLTPIQRRERLVANVRIRIDLLDIFQVLEHVE